MLLNDNGYPYFCVLQNGKVLWMTPLMNEILVNMGSNDSVSQTDINIGSGDPVVQGEARFNN